MHPSASLYVLREWEKETPASQSTEAFHDRILIIELEKFHVNSGVLMSLSPFFQCLFTGNFAEKDKNEIELKDVSAVEFKAFHDMAFTNNKFVITESNVFFLTKLSDRYTVDLYLNLLKKILMDNARRWIPTDALKFACDHNIEELKVEIEKIIVQTIDSHMRSRCRQYKAPFPAEHLASFYSLARDYNLKRLLSMKKKLVDLIWQYQPYDGKGKFVVNVVLQFLEKGSNDDYVKRIMFEILDRNIDKKDLLETIISHNMNELKDTFMRYLHRTAASVIKVLELCHQYNNEYYKTMIISFAEVNIQLFDEDGMISLLEAAFKYDINNWKETIGLRIFRSSLHHMEYGCKSCTKGIKKSDCTHSKVYSIMGNGFIAKNIDKIMTLPADIRDFILVSSVKYKST